MAERRNKNRITKLHSQSKIYHDASFIYSESCSYFSTLFNTDKGTSLSLISFPLGKEVTGAQALGLGMEESLDEI